MIFLPRSVGERYLEEALSWLRGRVWGREDGRGIGGIFAAVADEASELRDRLLDLVEEVDPRTSEELLPDWLRLLGLPDSCADLPATLGDRQLAAAAKLTGLGGLSPAAWDAYLAAGGYGSCHVTILEPWRVDEDAVDEELTGAAWYYALAIYCPLGTLDKHLACMVSRVLPPYLVALFVS